MRDFILRVYMKLKLFGEWLVNLDRLINFSYYLYKNDIFRKGDPSLVLRVLQNFTFYSFREYRDTLVMNRNACQSTALLGVLIDKWFEDHSIATLNQILEVLKNEFIEREKNGRKQF